MSEMSEKYELLKKYKADPNCKKTNEEIAAEFGINDREIYRWQNRKGFWDDVWNLFVNYFLQGELPEVNKALIDKAKDGDIEAIKTIYKLAKKLSDKLEADLTVKVEGFIYLKPDEVNNANNKADNQTGSSVGEATG